MNDVPLRNPVRPKFSVELDEASAKMLEILGGYLAGKIGLQALEWRTVRSLAARVAILEMFARYVEGGFIPTTAAQEGLALVPRGLQTAQIDETPANAPSPV